MKNDSLLGYRIRRFLLEHLVAERNLSINTQRSYRDTLRMLLPLLAVQSRKHIDALEIEDLSVAAVRSFLKDIEEKRRCSIITRNQRLSAIHALARFIGERSPEHLPWCGEIRAVPFKRAGKTSLTYLEKSEMDALLAAPDQSTKQGQRDRVLLLFLYNSGARASEAAGVKVAGVEGSEQRGGSVKLHGKGGKIRFCPLWPRTMAALAALITNRQADAHVFLNRYGAPVTRFGIHAMVERHAKRASEQAASLARKRVSPHTIRHTTATHLLRAGVDINTIRAWLGHVSIDTTNVYAEVDLEMKAKALAACDTGASIPSKKMWRTNPGVMEFLRSL
ncbi:MAG TPA: tyrosine-type recombinase/integrase [Terriglobales bacterium]|nr:tyrosine-type recombinase/integrase [Terriglobales bacterium]